jgi:NADPH:quinone reductase-like Zn-dependent oxidoreductase
MRAVVCTRYGPPEVLQLREVEKPVPSDDEVLIKIHATTVNSSDWFIRSALRSAPVITQILMRLVIGITRPRKPVLGMVLAGEIEETGKPVGRFRVGDRVYAFTKFRFGCYAQYTCLPETATMALAPSNLTYEEAAAIPYGGLLAMHFLRKGSIQSGQQVLIYGASGAVGTTAVQLAKHFGTVVTAACGTTNLELAVSLGADAVIDYTNKHAPGGKHYDLVLDAVGKRKTSRLKVACRAALAPGGKYVSVDDGMPRMTASDLALLTELVQAGKLKPVIDKRYPLEQIVEAHRYVEQGHKKGNVVVTVSHASSRGVILKGNAVIGTNRS